MNIRLIKPILISGLIVGLFSSIAFASGIADVPWNQSNIETLRVSDKAALANFLTPILGNYSGHGDCACVKPKDIGEFTWVDLAGDGRYELVTTLDVNGRAYFNALVIFWRDSSGKITFQQIEGWEIRNLGKVVRDLDGDGKDELIVQSELPPGNWSPTALTPVWPEIYSLKGKRYVQSSNEFPNFYDSEILPRLDQKIDKAHVRATSEPDNQYTVALLVLTKEHILRVLCRGLGANEYAQVRSANEEIARHAEQARTPTSTH